MNLEVLNAVRSLLVKFANERGISLAQEFKTQDDFKRFVIALCVKTLTDNGMSVKNAFDFVMGDGTYDGIVDQVWAECNA